VVSNNDNDASVGYHGVIVVVICWHNCCCRLLVLVVIVGCWCGVLVQVACVILLVWIGVVSAVSEVCQCVFSVSLFGLSVHLVICIFITVQKLSFLLMG